MINPVVVDTGPLVAILRERDEHHNRCVAALNDAARPLLTCWPVVTEAAWLLRNQAGGVRSLFQILASDAVEVVELDDKAVSWMARFLERYSSLQAQVPDAAVMYLAERHGTDAVFTLDRRDFSVYRLSNGKPLQLLPES
ncbi:MAG: PIN domain-containing protein [Planctomycetota bacterium]